MPVGYQHGVDFPQAILGKQFECSLAPCLADVDYDGPVQVVTHDPPSSVNRSRPTFRPARFDTELRSQYYLSRFFRRLAFSTLCSMHIAVHLEGVRDTLRAAVR